MCNLKARYSAKQYRKYNTLWDRSSSSLRKKPCYINPPVFDWVSVAKHLTVIFYRRIILHCKVSSESGAKPVAEQNRVKSSANPASTLQAVALQWWGFRVVNPSCTVNSPWSFEDRKHFTLKIKYET